MKCGRQVYVEDKLTAWLNSANTRVPCTRCNGSGIWMGSESSGNCEYCNGTGRVASKEKGSAATTPYPL
jgi:DnaJ-class molecular chaperone